MIVDAIQSSRTALDEKLEGVDHLLLEQKDGERLQGLAPLSPEEKYGSMSHRRQPRTRQWVFLMFASLNALIMRKDSVHCGLQRKVSE